MKPTGTHINYYHICHRKLWLFGHQVQMEQHSDLVAEGKLIGETTYPQRASRFREVDLGFVKIDHFDNKKKIVREVKKSNKMEAAHTAQVKYYLWVLEQAGFEASHGILEYPKLRQTVEVWLSDLDRLNIPLWVNEIQMILSGNCPNVIDTKICKRCAYAVFCYA